VVLNITTAVILGKRVESNGKKKINISANEKSKTSVETMEKEA
jgi:hypothetical protein